MNGRNSKQAGYIGLLMAGLGIVMLAPFYVTFLPASSSPRTTARPTLRRPIQPA